MIVVSDTSPISNLLTIGWLRLLPEVYGKVLIPPTVAKEVAALAAFGFDLSEFTEADWLVIAEPSNQAQIEILLEKLDQGEAEAIVLAEEFKADLLLIDERLGWQEAQKRGLKSTGLLGTLVTAKSNGIIPKVRPLIEELREKTRFRMSEQLIRHVLSVAEEEE